MSMLRLSSIQFWIGCNSSCNFSKRKRRLSACYRELPAILIIHLTGMLRLSCHVSQSPRTNPKTQPEPSSAECGSDVERKGKQQACHHELPFSYLHVCTSNVCCASISATSIGQRAGTSAAHNQNIHHAICRHRGKPHNIQKFDPYSELQNEAKKNAHLRQTGHISTTKNLLCTLDVTNCPFPNAYVRL